MNRISEGKRETNTRESASICEAWPLRRDPSLLRVASCSLCLQFGDSPVGRGAAPSRAQSGGRQQTMLCAGRRTVIAPAGARTCSEQRRASPAVLLPARRLASTRASAVKLQLRRRRVGVASAAAAAADLVPAVPAPPPKRRIAVFVEVRTTSSALVSPLIHRLSLVRPKTCAPPHRAAAVSV